MHRLLRVACAGILCGLVFGSRASSEAAVPPASKSGWLTGWPMDGHDPQRTYRSPAAGPLQPRLLFQRKGVIARYIAPDGGMYGVIAGKSSPYREAAFSPTGQVRWSHPAKLEGELVGLGPTGTVFQVDNMKASGYSPGGTRLWKTPTLGLLKGASPLIADTNVLYAPIVGPHGYSTRIGINLVSGTGTVLQLLPGDWSSPTLSPNRTVYLFLLGSTVLQANAPTGSALWQLDVGGAASSLLAPLVGKDGTIYVGNGTHIVSVTPDGRVQWTAAKPDGVLGMAERTDGSILAAGKESLDAFSADGNHLWSLPVGRSSDLYHATWPSLIVDAAGIAYVGSGDGVVRVVSADGKLLAHVPAGDNHYDNSPSILLSPDGRLVINGTDNVLRVYGS